MRCERRCRRLTVVGFAWACLAWTGCLSLDAHHAIPEPPAATLAPPANVPTELNMITLPPYVIGSPDVLLIDVLTEPREALGPGVVLSPQPIGGQHLVRPDGTVNLGVYGALSVAGLTTDQAQLAVRRHVYQKLKEILPVMSKVSDVSSPEKLLVVVDVVGYNSKAYYVITDGAGYGEQIFSFPIKGHETVLDALANINGLPAVGSKQHVWVARRTPHCNQPEQILQVDYVGLTQHGITQTNYQIMPGDRVYVRADTAFRVDGFLQKLLTPIERLMGVTLLGSSTYNSVTNRRQFNNNNGF